MRKCRINPFPWRILQHVVIGLAGVLFIFSADMARADGDSSEYERCLNEGVQAFKNHDDKAAFGYFNRAHLLVPAAEEPLEYINLLKRVSDGRLEDVSARPIRPDRSKVVGDVLDHVEEDGSLHVRAQEPAQKPASIPAPVNIPAPVPAAAVVSSKPSIVPSVTGVKNAPEVITIDDILGANQARPTLRIDVGSSVIIEGKNVQRFLEVEPGFLSVKNEGPNQIRVDAKKWGRTFLHIWDERGRTTIYVEAILPHSSESVEMPQTPAALEHVPPFRMKYGFDNDSYYSGRDLSHLNRGSRDIQQTAGMEGETPYGFFDTSLTVKGFEPITDVPTYTVGLSNIPLKGTNDLDLRFFDATRSLTPLTMPSNRLRGEFVDVRTLGNVVGISVSHGQQLSSFSYLYSGFSTTRDAYVDAVQFSLFPGNPDHQYTVNYATGYGPERDSYLTKQVYSVQTQQKIGKVALNAELARDDHTTSSLSGIHWANGLFQQGLCFRDINKKFTDIISNPSNQGEVGATWTTNTNTDRFSSDSFLDVYQDQLYPNEEHPDALNLDSNLHTRILLGEHYAVDTTVRYVDTPGLASPRRFASGDARLSRDFPVWGGRKGTIYAGGSDQRSRFEFSPESEYDRYGLLSGFQVPITRSLSGFMNYEYSWLFEKLSSETHHPAVTNTGLSYNKDINEKLQGTLGLVYRNEQSVKGTNSFLAGEDSVALSAGLVYTPKNDVSVYCDTRVRDVWAQIPGGMSYYDLDVRVGMRMTWGLGVWWDPQGIVAGFVYKDRDENKEFSPDIGGMAGDEGLPGVKVRIGDKEAVTDARGFYSLPVRGKRVVVTPVLESLPPGFVFSTPAFAKVDIVQGRTKRVDFGLTTQSGVYGVAFVDKNGNGLPDADERFVGKVKVQLDGKIAQVTDSHGAYFFKNVAQGKHTLTVDMAALPAEFIPLVKVKNEINVVEGTTYILHIPLKVKAE